MAKKYIDAQKLERHFENCIDESRNTNGVTKDFEIALIATKNQPAADVQEVRHGAWECTELMYESGCTRCSECKTEYYVQNLYEISGDTLPLYCSNCGAKMDGGENN